MCSFTPSHQNEFPVFPEGLVRILERSAVTRAGREYEAPVLREGLVRTTQCSAMTRAGREYDVPLRLESLAAYRSAAP